MAGKVKYKEQPAFPLAGEFRALLARLVRANGLPVHYDRLKEACGGSNMEDKSLEGQISRLRANLRTNLRLDKKYMPITYTDHKSFELKLL